VMRDSFSLHYKIVAGKRLDSRSWRGIKIEV